MRKTSLQRALLLAGAMALAGVGVAQAETFNTPTQAGEASTMTYGQPNMLTDNNGPVMNYDWTLTNPSTTVLGAGPVVEYDYTTPSTTVLGAGPLPPPVVTYDYYTPSTTVLGAGPGTITTYTYSTPMVCGIYGHDGASETSNVPLRAGEASTMTNGAPNLLSNNASC
jgi:hypothetical protein